MLDNLQHWALPYQERRALGWAMRATSLRCLARYVQRPGLTTWG